MSTHTSAGKYQPLTDFLLRQHTDAKSMSFEDIERVIGEPLPASASRHRAWWSNNPDNSVMTKAWLEAGFRSEQVDMKRRRLVFRRTTRMSNARPTPGSRRSSEHPLIGWM